MLLADVVQMREQTLYAVRKSMHDDDVLDRIVPSDLRLLVGHIDELQRRTDVADEMLSKLIDDIGTGLGVAGLRDQSIAIKRELRGIVRVRNSTAP